MSQEKKMITKNFLTYPIHINQINIKVKIKGEGKAAMKLKIIIFAQLVKVILINVC